MSGDSRMATRSYIVNNVPAHMQQAHSVSLQQQQRRTNYLAVPNSHIAKHMEEVPMYERVEAPRNFHGYSSLVQSTPCHSQPFHYSRFSNNQHQQQLELGHLEMSSASQGPFSACNGSSRVASTGSSSSSFIDYRSLNCSTAEDETDQPLNLSLKQQDVSRNSSFSSGNVHMPYGFLPSSVGGSNFRPHMVRENMRPSMKGNNVLHNNLVADVKWSSNSFSSSGASTKRPVPNLVHSHIDTQHGYQSFKVPYQHSAPQFMNPQAPYTNNLFHPRGHLYRGHFAHNPCSNPRPNDAVSHLGCTSGHSAQNPCSNLRPNDAVSYLGCSSGHSAQNPSSNLRPNDAVSHSGCSSGGKLYNTGADHLHTLQTAHQNALHPSLVQPFNTNTTYTETDHDLVVNQLTNSSHQHKDILKNSFCDDRREQLANYSLHFHETGESVGQDVGKYRDDRQCVDYKNAGLTHSISNCDRIQTYCTDGTPNLSAATPIAGLTLARKVEREDNAIGLCRQIKSTVEMNSIVSGTDMVAASMSGIQPLGRQTEAAVIAACQGQGLGAVFPKCTSQPADDQVVQENFYSYVDFNEGALDQTKTYREEGTPTSFSSLSSHSSQLCADPREATAMMELTCSDETNTPKSLKSIVANNRAAGPVSQPASNFRHTDTDETLKRNLELLSVACRENNQVEGTPLMFSRSSTPESLGSCDTQPILSSVASEYSWKASGVVSPSEIPDSPSELEPTHSPTKRLKDISVTNKCTDVITKQSLMTPSIVTAESWGNVPAVDEDKSNNFAVHGKHEDSHLMFSVLEKNILSTNRNHYQVLNSQARATPMTEEHVETESFSGKPGVFVEHAKEKIPQDCSETACLSAVTFASSLTRDVSEHSGAQDEPQEPSLPTVGGGESALQVAGFSEVMESKPAKDVIMHKDPNTTVSNEDSDSSVSDVSQEEEDILAQCIRFGMPAPACSAHRIKCKRQFGVGMQASSNLCADNPARMPSGLKSGPKKLAPLFNYQDNITSDNILVETEDCLQLDIPKNKARSKLVEHNGKTNRKRSPSRDSRLSDSSCSSTTLPVTHFSKNLKKIGGKIESPESRVRLGAVFELSGECSILEQAYFQSVPLQLRSAV